jgi:hypothetical protein
LSGTAFYFVPPSGKAAVGTPRPSAAEAARARETLLWQGALNANTSGAYQEYLRAYPRGNYAEIARQNLSRIAQAARPALPSPGPQQSLAPPFMPRPSIGELDAIDYPELIKRPIRLAALATAPPSVAGDITRGRFEFIPSGRLRRELKGQFQAAMNKASPEMEAALRSKIEFGDIFGDIDRSLDQSSLSPSNFSDAIARMITIVMQMQTGAITQSRADLENTRAVSQQIALILARDPNFNALGSDRTQALADSTWLNIWMITDRLASIDPGNAKSRLALAKGLMANLKSSFGIDLAKLRVTSRGLVPR